VEAVADAEDKSAVDCEFLGGGHDGGEAGGGAAAEVVAAGEAAGEDDSVEGGEIGGAVPDVVGLHVAGKGARLALMVCQAS
jgi:hypothetical protein